MPIFSPNRLLSPQVPYIPPLSCGLVRRQDTQPVGVETGFRAGVHMGICEKNAPLEKSIF